VEPIAFEVSGTSSSINTDSNNEKKILGSVYLNVLEAKKVVRIFIVKMLDSGEHNNRYFK